MFMKNSKIARITVGYVVASLMLFSTVMPASAADMQFRENIGTGVSIDEEVQEDFLGPRHPELSDEAAAPVTDTGNGGTVLVMPRSDLDEPVSMDQNEVVEDAVTVEDEAADEDEEIECDPEEVDKSELEAAIAAAGELDEADYTAETWGVFASAMEAAEAVMVDEEATQEEVDNALAELNSAVDALEEVVVEVDKSELEA
ncbi:MAG: FIVAR domain-containing protein, partial [Firmicutes bacterium]|nr:FIVAR domain-containing protein [Bacillota bacterium]